MQSQPKQGKQATRTRAKNKTDRQPKIETNLQSFIRLLHEVREPLKRLLDHPLMPGIAASEISDGFLEIQNQFEPPYSDGEFAERTISLTVKILSDRGRK